MCKEKGCNNKAFFNTENATRALYCDTHKLDGMVDVKSKTCAHTDCKKEPTYNKTGEAKPLYCSLHKTEGMVDMVNRICAHTDCKKHPLFNKKGEKGGLYCNTHKLEGMVNVKHKRCIHPNCNKIPSYNKDGETNALYCIAHKLEGMINVKSKTCIHPDCGKQPTYNKVGQSKALYCSVHKTEGMVNVVTKTCIYPDCGKISKYNKKGETKALYCNAHKKEEMVNVKNKTCKSDWCSTQIQKKYDGYCLFCYINLFPDKPVTRNYKTKEFSVVEYVKTQFPNLPWITDKKVNGGLSRRRPDLLLDLLYQIVIIEVDENQHNNYDCSCQNKRIMELSQDVGHRPIVFIRFNPDDYEQNGKNISSCWGQDKKGICVVKKTKKNEWTQRLNVLEHHITYWLNPENTTNKTIETIQLFYDV
jgi:hypothetical protein